MFNYDEYLKNQDSLSFEEAVTIYNEIMKSADINDSTFKELWNDVIESASKYIQVRNEWLFLSQGEKVAKDSLRTAQHNSFMATLSSLERYMEMQSWKMTWVADLGKIENENRKRLGDFAGYLLCIGSLKAR
ncbi:hypothetical protein BSQ39_04185 [Loigolactobacillus backii]|uniref:hypothetical protein n=1 Tax=Loigolactobacillus backii TaxID=375175 RepID=UPI000C1CAD92|nr:hypothetical protein [Loigolactobacillus backii]PIO82829.1 hypothetical protein BSQ39_04185 [Loigolactobacillus backii]